MGIVYFPDLYEDELIYSVLARYYVHQGYLNYSLCAEDIFVEKGRAPEIEFSRELNQEAKEMLCRNKTIEEVMEKHTMYPYYARFLPREKRERAFQTLCSMRGNYYNLLEFPKMKNGEQRYLRYCPLCANEDRQVLGETYWHRNHQLRNINVCHRHGCRLCNSSVSMLENEGFRLVNAENEVGTEDASILYGSDLEKEVAEYVVEMFQSKFDMQQDITVKEFFQAHLVGTPYISVRGKAKKTSLLYKDFLAYYSELQMLGYEIPEKSRIEKIFTGYRFNGFEICLLTKFLKLDVNTLVEMKMPEEKISFDKLVLEMLEQEIGVNEISRRLGVSSKTVRDIRDDKYVEVRKPRVYQTPCGKRAKDWEQMDKELLPLVKQAVNELKKADRPKKISRYSVSKRLNIPYKRMPYLTLCNQEIEKHKVSQQAFWARECIWAIKKAKENGQTLSRNSIMIPTNMRPVNVLSCLPELKKLDENAYCIIKTLFAEVKNKEAT